MYNWINKNSAAVKNYWQTETSEFVNDSTSFVCCKKLRHNNLTFDPFKFSTETYRHQPNIKFNHINIPSSLFPGSDCTTVHNIFTRTLLVLSTKNFFDPTKLKSRFQRIETNSNVDHSRNMWTLSSVVKPDPLSDIHIWQERKVF